MKNIQSKIVNPEQAILIAHDLNKNGKKIVLTGGCFDILHIGHIIFLIKAKETGDKLFILLESDQQIRKIKGENRPINSQTDRAIILAALAFVDLVITLPEMTNDKEYDKLIAQIRPKVIAVTNGDPLLAKKEMQAKMVGGIIKNVTNRIAYSTTERISKLS